MLVLAAAALSLAGFGFDAGSSLGVSGVNRAGDNVLFAGLNLEAHLRLHFDAFFLETSSDLSWPIVARLPNAKGLDLLVGSADSGASIGTALLVGYALDVEQWSFAAGVGPWAGFVPYSCGDCDSIKPAVGAAFEARVGFRPVPSFAFEAVAQLDGGYPSTLRPSVRLAATYLFGDP